MESLRIGMFAWESLHGTKVGGLAPHVTELSEGLAARGHEVHVFTRAGSERPYDVIGDVSYQRIVNDTSNGIISQMDSMCAAMSDRFCAVERLFGRFDVLHGHDWHPVTALMRIKRHELRDFIFTFHSTEWGRNGNHLGATRAAHEISRRERLAGDEAQALVVTSPSLRGEVLRLYHFAPHKLNLIPNGIYPGKMRRKADPEAVKELYGISLGAPMILFIGRMCYQKGPDLLVAAIRHVLKKRSDARFVFAGEGDMREYCEHLARQLGIEDACMFLGYVPDDELVSLLNACDLVVVPSRNEPFGIVVLEAWDACKPVVCTDAVQIIDNFVNGIKARVHPESLAWYIANAIDRPQELRGLTAQGKQLIDAMYNWDYVSEQTLGLYRSIL